MAHLALAHWLLLLGFHLLIKGFPGQKGLQDGTIWDAPLLFQRGLVI